MRSTSRLALICAAILGGSPAAFLAAPGEASAAGSPVVTQAHQGAPAADGLQQAAQGKSGLPAYLRSGNSRGRVRNKPNYPICRIRPPRKGARGRR